MRILMLFIFSFSLNSTEVIVDPYEDLDYTVPNSYTFQDEKNDCECYCHDYIFR